MTEHRKCQNCKYDTACKHVDVNGRGARAWLCRICAETPLSRPLVQNMPSDSVLIMRSMAWIGNAVLDAILGNDGGSVRTAQRQQPAAADQPEEPRVGNVQQTRTEMEISVERAKEIVGRYTDDIWKNSLLLSAARTLVKQVELQAGAIETLARGNEFLRQLRAVALAERSGCLVDLRWAEPLRDRLTLVRKQTPCGPEEILDLCDVLDAVIERVAVLETASRRDDAKDDGQ